MKAETTIYKKAQQVVFHLADNPKMKVKEKAYLEGVLNALNWAICPHCPDPFDLRDECKCEKKIKKSSQKK